MYIYIYTFSCLYVYAHMNPQLHMLAGKCTYNVYDVCMSVCMQVWMCVYIIKYTLILWGGYD